MATIKIKGGIHFTKTQPAESHILVTGSPADDSAEYVFDNTTAVPNAGNFTANSIFSDTSGNASTGRFSIAPDESVAYCNGVTSAVWSGVEARCPAFLLGEDDAPTTDFSYNYTTEVNNKLTTSTNVATLYRHSDDKVYIYIGSLRPLKGIKVYIGTANAAAATTAVNYWTGTAWSSVSSLVDGTMSDGKTFAVTGTLAFTSTASTAKIRVLANRALYFYQIVITGFTGDTITVSRCTLDAPMQAITDIWDGIPRRFVHAEVRLADGSAQAGTGDITSQLSSVNLVNGDTTTYYPITNDMTSNGLFIGFLERLQGIYFHLWAGSDAHTGTITVSYWNGTSWTSVSGQVDKTTPGLSNSGWITWTPSASGTEHKRALAGEGELYYYRITFSGTFSSLLDHVSGMPAPQDLGNYSIPALWQNRLVLLGSIEAKQNSMRISGYGTNCIFNGSDSLLIENIGDDSPIVAAGTLFSRDTGGFYDTLVICKNRETWLLDGTTVTNYRLYKVSDRYGCVAPHSFAIMQLGVGQGVAKHIAIWQSATGIIAFDGQALINISADIKNYFEKENTSEAITAAYIDDSVGFVDEREQEYHWIFASGSTATALNTELVYSFARGAWFKIDRTIVLQCGFSVYSTLGDAYTYGGTTTGYIELLENPSVDTFDGNVITHTITTRDIPMQNWNQQSVVRRLKLFTKANSGVSATISHIADGNTSADSTTVTVSPTDATKRVVQGKGSINWGHNVFHGFQVVVAGNSGTTLFEPIALTGYYQDVRMDY